MHLHINPAFSYVFYRVQQFFMIFQNLLRNLVNNIYKIYFNTKFISKDIDYSIFQPQKYF